MEIITDLIYSHKLDSICHVLKQTCMKYLNIWIRDYGT